MMILQEIYRTKLEKHRRRINAQLQQVIIEEQNPGLRALLEAALHNGRRFRPLLFILTFKVLGHEPEKKGYELAAAIEMLHKASLIHDDLIDGDEFRRGKAAFHRLYGSAKAVITGDLLVAAASLRFVRLAGEEFSTCWLAQYYKLCYGELLDVLSAELPTDYNLVEEMTYGKTASFLEFIMEIAAAVCGAPLKTQRLLADFGREVGFIFQYINDWNNWSGREMVLGRAPGTDLARGKINLIAFLGEKAGHPSGLRERLSSIIEEHTCKALQKLDELGIENQYTKVLRKILAEKYADWYWTEQDE